MSRGSAWVARERDIAQRPYKRPEFIDHSGSLLPVKGEIVIVNGLPVTKTGRILTALTQQQALDVVIAEATLRLEAKLREDYEKTLPKVMPIPETIKKARSDPSDEAFHRPVQRRTIYKRPLHHRWQDDGFGMHKEK